MKNNSPFLLSALPIFTRALITFVRANNPTYSFISLLCIQQYYCLSPFVNLVVALSLSYQGQLHYVLLQIMERLKAAFNIFLDVSRYYPFTPFRLSYISFSVQCSLFDCHNTNHRSSKFISLLYINFCGAQGCQSYQEHFAKTEKNSANLECIPYFSRNASSILVSHYLKLLLLSFFLFFVLEKLILKHQILTSLTDIG